jgi:hypothetical protein
MNELSADSVLDRLQTVLDVRSDSALARALGVNRATLGNWRQRNSIPYSICVQFAIDQGLSLNWLFSGQGAPRELSASQDIQIVNETPGGTNIATLYDALDANQQLVILEMIRTARRLTSLENAVAELQEKLSKP